MLESKLTGCCKVRSTVLTAITDGCETWSVTLREEHKMKVFKNRVLKRIFGPMTEKMARGSKNLHNEELRNLYTALKIIRVIESRRVRWAGTCSTHGNIRHAYKILVAKPEETMRKTKA